MGRRKIKEIEYGIADIKLAYQKLVRKARREGTTFDYTYTQFENRVRNRQYEFGVKKYTIRQALLKEIHSTAIMGYTDIARQNMMNAIRAKFPAVFDRIKGLIGDTRENGLFVPIYQSLEWDDGLESYTFIDKNGNRWAIITKNSPEIIDLQRV